MASVFTGDKQVSENITQLLANAPAGSGPRNAEGIAFER
jgi:hypothetical protein